MKKIIVRFACLGVLLSGLFTFGAGHSPANAFAAAASATWPDCDPICLYGAVLCPQSPDPETGVCYQSGDCYLVESC